MVPVREYMRENADNQAALEKGGLEVNKLPLRLSDDFMKPNSRDILFDH